ncbi:MAG: polyphosphate kinase 1, partial [Verrucomicrobiae bacterium]|nr:polyphosphate kinase 1 [Verrucomicrobiae bacterium]
MPTPIINRELSWIEFNQRVLNEASRDDLPLLERLKFLAITASNLDEFFQVRVGGLMMMMRGGLKSQDASGLTPQRTLAAIRQRIHRMTVDQHALLDEVLLPGLAKAGIRLLPMSDLTIDQATRAATTFDEQIYPLLTPLAVEPDVEPPVVPALQLVVACRLLDPEQQSTRHALVPIPDNCGRRIEVSAESEEHAFVLVEDLVSTHAGRLFPGEKVTATTVFRVTRNGDIAVQEEDAIDLAGEMEDVLTARRFADTVRLEIRAGAPRDLARMVHDVTAAGTKETQKIHGPIGLASFMELAFLRDFDHLRDSDWPGQNSPAVTPGASMFETIAKGDVLLHHPYETFEPVLRLLE